MSVNSTEESGSESSDSSDTGADSAPGCLKKFPTPRGPRPSGTERGVVRRGVSISHWETTLEAAEVVERVHKYIDDVLSSALDVVETDGR